MNHIDNGDNGSDGDNRAAGADDGFGGESALDEAEFGAGVLEEERRQAAAILDPGPPEPRRPGVDA